MPDVRADDRATPASRSVKVEPILGGLVAIHSGLEDLTRLRHPSLAPAEMGPDRWRATARCAASSATRTRRRRSAASAGSPASARACRKMPDYAAAFQAIGPAAIKLGQALATRPDLVGEEAARDLLQPAGQRCRPRRSSRSGRRSRRRFGRRSRRLFAEIDPEPGRRRLDRPGPPRRHHRRPRRSRSRCCARASRRSSPATIDTYEWAAAQVEAIGGEAARLRPRLVIANFRQWTDARARPAPRGRLGLRAGRGDGRPSPAIIVPAIDWDRTARRVMTLEWIDGIKTQRPRRADRRRPRPEGARRATSSAPSCARRSSTASSTPTCTRAICSRCPTARIAAIDFGIMGRIDRQRAASGWPRSSTA